MDIVKFSAGYNRLNPNFVIQNVHEGNKDPRFSVLYNIFERGCPTLPSRFLQSKFGQTDLDGKFLYKINFASCKWNEVIKGGDNKNPALEFYENLLPKFVKAPKSFISECPINEIIGGNDKIHKVDFYSPLYNVVVEIDGQQHNIDNEQVVKDKDRDSILKGAGVKIIRIPTDKIYDEEFLRKNLSSLQFDTEYFSNFKNKYNPSINESAYCYSIRLEILLTMLYENGIIDLNQKELKINICCPEQVDEEKFNIALIDFFSYLKNFTCLQNIDFEVPDFTILMVEDEEKLSKQEGINIYISAIEVYSQAKYKNVFYVRNDFFPYEQNSTKKIYKNYYKNHNSYIKYNLNISKHEEALKFFLRNTSKYNEFRENQLEIIIECLNSTSVIGILPTGAGKSLCYQFCSLLIPSATLVVAPLQILMQDQCDNIRKNFGIKNSTLINSINFKNISIFENEKSLITIISPERFFSEKFTNILKSGKVLVGFVVIDEAHCLSEWGHDFRTSYLCLSHNLRLYLPPTTYLMALTGTASHRVFEDIDCEFQYFKQKKTAAIFADNMRRDNLTIYVERPANIYKATVENLTPTFNNINQDKTLIFTKTKNQGYSLNQDNPYGDHDSACISLVQDIKIEFADIIKNPNYIDFYAGGKEMDDIKKAKVLRDFKSGKLLIVFATKAFGMGVDVPDIRKTIHYGLPSSMEGLYQEIGRAGRDGKPSKCYIYYAKENIDVLKDFFCYPTIPMHEMKEKLNSLIELRTNFYFIQSANLDEDIEIKFIKVLLREIKNSSSHILDSETIIKYVMQEIKDSDLFQKLENSDNAKIHIEKALYRLFLLGEIKMWNVVYKEKDILIDNYKEEVIKPIFINLLVTDFSEEEKMQRLRQHILKYQTNFDFSEENTFDNRLKFLIKWSNENYLQERIQAMKTLYEQCENYVDSNTFMSYIANYFSNDPIYMRLVDRNISLKEWIDVLNTYPEVTRARISRLLESYDKITSLNYISGITRLRLDEFKNSDGRRRLMMALEDISKFDEVEREYLFDNTYSLLNNEQREIFIECWLQNIKQDVYKIIKKTGSEICQNYLIVNACNELMRIGDILNDKL